MKTAAGAKVYGTGLKTKRSLGIRSFFSWVAWVYDRFVFHVLYRGRRLRSEVREELQKDLEDVKRGKNTSPGFTNTEDMAKWLDSQDP